MGVHYGLVSATYYGINLSNTAVGEAKTERSGGEMLAKAVLAADTVRDFIRSRYTIPHGTSCVQ